MKIISHRGNLTGSNPIRENSIDYVEEAISEGFDVEVDVRVEDHQFYLGHDDPQYYIPMSWLVKWKDKLWIHCKNLRALDVLSSSPVDFNYFWHEKDKYTLTSKGIGWVLVGEYPYSKSIIVLPEFTDLYSYSPEYIKKSYGICTDIPIYYKEKFLNEMEA
jgi:glycerophosphoryl diester phosphodiesterase